MKQQIVPASSRTLAQRLLAADSVLILFILLIVVSLSRLHPAFEFWWSGFFILIFLVVLSLVVLKLARPFVNDISHYRLQASTKSLAAMHNSKNWKSDLSKETLRQCGQRFLEKNGFKVKCKQTDNHILLAAIKGRANRVGFFLTHVGFIFLCVGAFLDSDFLLNRYLKNVDETTSVPVRRDLGRYSLQGEMLLKEGVSNDEFSLTTETGTLTQILPFKLSLRQLKHEGGVTGLIDKQTAFLHVYDSHLDTPADIILSQSSSAQHRGYDLYLQSVSSGDSILKIRAWPLFRPYISALKMNTKINAQRELQTGRGAISIKFSDLKLRNITTAQVQSKAELPYKNVGPKLFFTSTIPGQPIKEYMVYMLPIQQQGRWFYITGVRTENETAYKYLHIPADAEGNVQRFLEFHSMLHDQKQVLQTIQQTVLGNRAKANKLQQQMVNILYDAVNAFNQAGIVAVEKLLAERIPADKLAPFMQTTVKLLRKVFFQLYTKVLENEYKLKPSQLSNLDLVFFDDALSAHAGLGDYGLPFYIQLDDFEYRPELLVKVMRKPGRGLFFFGTVTLLIGMLFMIYIRYRRLWLYVEEDSGVSQVIFSGAAYRHTHAFAIEFEALSKQLEQELSKC